MYWFYNLMIFFYVLIILRIERKISKSFLSHYIDITFNSSGTFKMDTFVYEHLDLENTPDQNSLTSAKIYRRTYCFAI